MSPVQLKRERIVRSSAQRGKWKMPVASDPLGRGWVLIQLTRLGTLLYFSFAKQPPKK